MWITTNWKIFEETGITDHLTCLLRNLYAGQEATVRTGHGTTDRFKIGKAVYQACLYCHPAYLDTDFYLSYIWLPSFSNTVCWEDNFSPINYIDSFVKSQKGLFLYFLFFPILCHFTKACHIHPCHLYFKSKCINECYFNILKNYF